jgi:hypothetical protein
MGVLPMAAILYGIYILVSRPRYDEKLGVWLPYASVSWDGNKYQYHQLTSLGKSFDTQEEAEAFGFVAARGWIDEHKSD